MGAFWKAIGAGLKKAVVWCISHSDTLITIAGAVIDAKKKPAPPAEPPK